MSDLIDRQTAIDAVQGIGRLATLPDNDAAVRMSAVEYILFNLPSAQPEPLSDAYMKAVWAWLIDYQIKVAELKGRYTPYVVLSWVANDWRKEHEQRSNQQTGGD